MTLACTGVLLMLTGIATSQARAADRQGTILSVDMAGKKMVVLDLQTSRNIDVGLSDQTRIVTTTNKPLQIGDLKRGDKIGYTEVNGQAMNMQVQQADLKGVVSTIDVGAQKLVITEAVTDREIPVALNPNTRIETHERKSLALKDIKTGDGVAVTYSGAAPVSVVVNSKPPELKGHIKSIGADKRTIVVTEIGNNIDVTVAITPETTIVSNSGKTLGINDLKKGDGVGIAHRSSVASMIVVSPTTNP